MSRKSIVSKIKEYAVVAPDLEEVVTEDVYWGSDGIARRVMKSDDEDGIEFLLSHGWLKEYKEGK